MRFIDSLSSTNPISTTVQNDFQCQIKNHYKVRKYKKKNQFIETIFDLSASCNSLLLVTIQSFMNIDHMNFECPLQGEWFPANCAVELLLHSALEFQMRAQSPGASVLAAAISGAEIQIAFALHGRAYVPQTWKKDSHRSRQVSQFTKFQTTGANRKAKTKGNSNRTRNQQQKPIGLTFSLLKNATRTESATVDHRSIQNPRSWVVK